MTNNALIWLLSSLSVVGAALATPAEPRATDTPVGLIECLSWTAPSEAKGPRALYVFQATPDSSTTGLFVEAAKGTRVVLSVAFNPRSGEMRHRVVDDQTGWWIEIVKESGIQAANLSEALERAGEELTADKVAGLPGRLRFKGSEELGVFVPNLPSGRPDCGSVAQQVTGDARARLIKQIPEHLNDSAAFLDAALGLDDDKGFPQAGANLRCGVELIAALVRQEGLLKASSNAWKQEAKVAGGGRGILELKSDEDRRFVSSFKSVADRARPLVGHRVEDEMPRTLLK